MAQKRKSSPIESVLSANGGAAVPASSSKRPRIAGKENAGPADVSSNPAYTRWQDVPLAGEHDNTVRVYDDCNDVRRKIRLLLATPGFDVTPWLEEIGSVDHESYQHFVSATGAMGGAENCTFRAAYLYFEKMRVMEGRSKTKKRLDAERALKDVTSAA